MKSQRFLLRRDVIASLELFEKVRQVWRQYPYTHQIVFLSFPNLCHCKTKDKELLFQFEKNYQVRLKGETKKSRIVVLFCETFPTWLVSNAKRSDKVYFYFQEKQPSFSFFLSIPHIH